MWEVLTMKITTTVGKEEKSKEELKGIEIKMNGG